jgi:hypothetical protein
LHSFSPLAVGIPLVSGQKWCISLEFKAGSKFKPEEYCRYFEDLNLLPNAEIK